MKKRKRNPTAMGDAFNLEQMMDRRGAAGLAELYAEICYEKADHVRTNWQDHALARAWQRLGVAAGTLATRARKEQL
jgi:hypothetical protein